jgi:hypothetical protein
MYELVHIVTWCVFPVCPLQEIASTSGRRIKTNDTFGYALLRRGSGELVRPGGLVWALHDLKYLQQQHLLLQVNPMSAS